MRPHVRYLGLGHLHRRVEHEGWVFGPGSVEACSIDEHARDRGFFVVSLPAGEGPPVVERRAFAGRPVFRRRLEVDPATPRDDVPARLEALFEGVLDLERARFRGSIFEVTIAGRTGFDRAELDLARLRRVVAQKTGALVPIVTLDLVEEDLILEEGLPRETLERRVFERLVGAGDYKRCEAEIVDFALDLVPQLEQGVEPAEIIARLRGLREALEAKGCLGTKARTARGGGRAASGARAR
jgi:hypothetical protein